ncbi:coiled-coil domain-containing protein 180 isoform X2 [Turdus rufiventris]|nr:coiled-coil domain-containing protein 180 isoform X2 [Turdus rufiventris]
MALTEERETGNGTLTPGGMMTEGLGKGGGGHPRSRHSLLVCVRQHGMVPTWYPPTDSRPHRLSPSLLAHSSISNATSRSPQRLVGNGPARQFCPFGGHNPILQPRTPQALLLLVNTSQNYAKFKKEKPKVLILEMITTRQYREFCNASSYQLKAIKMEVNLAVPEEAGSGTWNYLTERQQKHHDRTVTEMQQELDCIGREMEASVLKLQEFLQLKVMKSDEKSKLLFEKIASDMALEGFSFEIADVLTKYSMKLEEISFFFAADVHRIINDKAMNINRALLDNERATAKLLFNLMKSELEKEKLHQLKWQGRVKDWKLIQKNYVVQSFREFMASEEIQNPPNVKIEMENMMKEQIVLSEQRLRVLQYIGYLTLVSYFDSALLPPTHTKSDVNEWYRTLENLNKNIDTHNMECMEKISMQYELVQGKCQEKVQMCKMTLLDMNIYTVEDVEVVHSNMLQMTEKLKHRFEEEVEHMDMTKDDLDTILEKMKMANSEEELKKYLENTLSSLDQIRTRNETLKQIVMDEVMAYPKAILWELISYSISISQHFSVKEIIKQSLQGTIDFKVQDQNNTTTVQTGLFDIVASKIVPGLEESTSQPRAEQDNHLSQLVPEDKDSCQESAGETNLTEKQVILAQKIEETDEEEHEENIPYESEENEHAEQELSIMQSASKSSEAESAEITMEVFSTASGNTYTVLGVEETGKADITESYFTKYEKEESLPMYLKYVLLTEAMFVKLKKRICLCFFEHLEKWFAESLSNSYVFVAAKKEELNSILLLHLRLYQQKQEEIQTNIYNARAAELSLHKERLECHCAVLAEGLKMEKAEFLTFSDQLNNLNKNFYSRVCNLEYDLLHTPVTEQSASSSSDLESELCNHLESIRVTVRSYQQHLEEALGKLRDLNVGFLKSCRLFSEVGDFSSEEVKFFNKCLQKESKQIDSYESSIKTDVEKIKSSCLEQAIELFKQSEKKFAFLSLSRAFMEKFHQSLRKLRQQIKSEVMNSNLQSVTLKSYLEELQRKRDAYVHSTVDKEVTSNQHEMEDFSTPDTDGTLQEDFTTLDVDGRLQDFFASAIPKESLRDESKRMVMGLDSEKLPLLNPSGMDTSIFDDLAISVIKNLAGAFTEIIMNILWKGNNTLLCLGEEFYGEKKNPQMGMLEDLPDTFEHWAEMLRLKLLSYQRQTDDYYNFCLRATNSVAEGHLAKLKDLYKVTALSKEFWDQLKWFEEELSSVSQLVVESLLKEHEQKLSSFTGHIQHLFNRQLKEWEDVKDCAAECAQSFFSALAALTEKLLLELDETITVDDVKIAGTEITTENISTLKHRKQAGLPLGTSKFQQLVKRGRRSWPGLPETTLPDSPDYTLCRGTASVSTAKTTLGHLAVMDAREAAYKKYKSKVEQMFALIKEESAAQLLAIQHWNDWWEESVQKIKRLYV